MKDSAKARLKARQEMFKKNILLMTGMTENHLSQMIFKTAINYMKTTGMADEWLQQFLKEPLFWAWWRGQWNLVDQEFYYHYSSYKNEPKCRKELRHIYATMHISIDAFPDNVIYEEIHNSYNKTSQQILKKLSEITSH